MLPLPCMFLTRCLVVIVDIIIIIICSCTLIIPSEVQVVQDVIHALINHALTSDHLSRPIFLDHLELRLDLLLLGFVIKLIAYW